MSTVTNKPNPLLGLIGKISLVVSVVTAIFLMYCIITGFPPEIAGHVIKIKKAKPLFLISFLSFIGWLALHPQGIERLRGAGKSFSEFTAKKKAVWILFLVYAVLFVWQQICAYYAITINFLPFSFFDYMFYFLFEEGKINYTGDLHSYYHLNNILLLLAPFWAIFRSSWVLQGIYGILGAAAVFPVFGISRLRFKDTLPAFVMGFIYLNYRYLQNVLEMNFSIEICYPLTFLTCLYLAMRKKWVLYYIVLFLGLSIKEDSFLYFCGLGLIVGFLRNTLGAAESKGKWEYVRHGAVTIVFSLVYFILLIKVFVPLTGNTIMEGSLNNYDGYGESVSEIVGGLLAAPAKIFNALFGSRERLETYLKLVERLAFLPILSPVFALITIPLFPLFLQTGTNLNFIQLRFHYAATVLPFITVALIFGYSNLAARFQGQKKKWVIWGFSILLILLNGGSFRTDKITSETLESIRWAKSVPQGTNLVTHGHFLPHVGYRRPNYYFANAWDYVQDENYLNADYYLIDFNVKLYPADKEFIQKKVDWLLARPEYELIREQPGSRYLFKRRS